MAGDYSFVIKQANAVGTWNGQDTLRVPISWCAVQGSPAQANPNLAGDTATDAILWRRHERPTDNIYIPQAGITFRSAINNAWGTLNFPIINDPDTTLGVQGDMRGENVNTFGQEFNAMINACDTAWTNLGRAGIGITTINAGAFHDGTGTYVGVAGWGGCNRFVGTNTCVTPYDGRVTVVDNIYLHPASPNRRFPGTNVQFVIMDSIDIVAGHEFGHSLGLDHRTNVQALMNPRPVDNGGAFDTMGVLDNVADNIVLNNTEVNTVRTNSQNVGGVQIDPESKVLDGQFTMTRHVDRVKEIPNLPPFLDLASVKVVFDTKNNQVHVGQQLFGSLTEKVRNVQFWTVIDADNNANTGGTADDLRKLGIDRTSFKGAEIIAVANVDGLKVGGSFWKFQNGKFVQLPDGFKFYLEELVMQPYLIPLEDVKTGKIIPPPGEISEIPVHHVVTVQMDNKFTNLALNKPFVLQTVIVDKERQIVEKLDDTELERGVKYVLELPSFPQCFPQDDVQAGGKVKIRLEGFPSNSNLHGLLGPELVFTGKTDERGGGVIDFPIPANAREGLHLVTIGVDNTALTADCEVNVVKQKPPLTCPAGTVLKGTECVPVEKPGGDCIFATAAYGSEMAPQIQMLRELRDETVLNTEVGTHFTTYFNSFYYSFSPTIADYERENPAFKEAVRIAITPFVATASLANYFDLDSEYDVGLFGLGIILMNVGMYVVAPAILISKLVIWLSKNRR